MTNKRLIFDLSEKHGPSFYLVDIDKFETNYLKLRSAFAEQWSNFNIAYSYKTNYLPCICKKVQELGGFAEVVSEMELEIALKCNVPYENIIWNGPVKNRDALKQFFLRGGSVNVDNLDELKFIASICEDHHETSFKIGIRINFDIGDNNVSRFGFDCSSRDFVEGLDLINKTKNLELSTIHFHFAKRVLDYWPNRVKGLISVLKKYDLKPKTIDFGGGIYGELSPDFANQLGVTVVSYQNYADAILPLLNDWFDGEKPLLLIEPGTALVSDCLHYFATVDTIKKVDDLYFASLTGSQKNISMNGLNPPIEVFNRAENTKIYNNVLMVGYTCIENDVLYKGYKGPLGKGDIVSFGNCGSYSLVMKPPFILPNCPVISISKGIVKVEKRAETFADLFSSYIF